MIVLIQSCLVNEMLPCLAQPRAVCQVRLKLLLVPLVCLLVHFLSKLRCKCLCLLQKRVIRKLKAQLPLCLLLSQLNLSLAGMKAKTNHFNTNCELQCIA